MCGIVGAIAERNVAKILIEGLKRLEYRGYDSAGIAILTPETHEIQRERVLGKVAGLEEALKKQPLNGHAGIAHTRWATHGEPNTANAHPHCSHDEVAIVHNGIIENHEALRRELTDKGYEFKSETDTEVIAHLIHHHWQETQDFVKAIRLTTAQLKGAYALGIVSKFDPEHLYAIRRGSPLVIGVGIGENFIGSDPLALIPVTQKFIYLEEGDIAKLTVDSVVIFDETSNMVTREIHESDLDNEATSKAGYRHFMLKEIFEQPDSLTNTISGHLNGSSFLPQIFGHNAPDIFKDLDRVQIVACGTSFHAGLIAKYWLESIAGVPCQVEIASEYRYRRTVKEPNTLFVALSQSGETADTLAALREAKKSGYKILAICNVPQSSLIREADLCFLMNAGSEIGVAATKTFTAQLVALLLLTAVLGEQNNFSLEQASALHDALNHLPKTIQDVLKLDKTIQNISKQFNDHHNAIFLGRGEFYPIALEGALKLKEISYMHAEAYPAGELKHGPLALVDENMPVIVIAPKNTLAEKLESNIQEVKSRGGELYIFADESLDWKSTDTTTVINMPSMPEITAPIAYTIPLQLLAYHVAVLKGTDVDQPRNLAKSVTVE